VAEESVVELEAFKERLNKSEAALRYATKALEKEREKVAFPALEEDEELMAMRDLISEHETTAHANEAKLEVLEEEITSLKEELGEGLEREKEMIKAHKEATRGMEEAKLELTATKKVTEKLSNTSRSSLHKAGGWDKEEDKERLVTVSRERDEALKNMEELTAVWEAECQNTEMAMEQNKALRGKNEELKGVILVLKESAHEIESSGNHRDVQDPNLDEPTDAQMMYAKADAAHAKQEAVEEKCRKLEKAANQLHTLGT